ncbi:MAG: hypothetical protein ACU0A5_13530 [Salipiger marinus]|uniref:hypothetical protein n=1 Tax=Salipiger marinus TaxID=555512 RepID=UPI004059042A
MMAASFGQQLTSRAAVVLRAQEVGAFLPDEQRIALGVTLILEARCPESYGAVRHAERLIGGHARMLLSDALRHEECPLQNMAVAATTHGSVSDCHSRGGDASREPRPLALTSRRAVWAWLRDAERRFADSLWGDLLACICVCVIFLALPLLLWGLS